MMRRMVCFRNRFKSTIVSFTAFGLFLCFIFYLDVFSHSDQQIRHKNERRIASYDGKELEAILSQTKSRSSIINKPVNPYPRRFPPIRVNNAMLINSEQRKNMKYRGGYASRTLIEDATLPEVWSESPNLIQKLSDRKELVKRVCKKYNLDKPSAYNQPNAWEYIYNEKFNLLWCPVFKSASSSWMFNFNLLAGYDEEELYKAKDTPIALARKRYPRLDYSELKRIQNGSESEKPLTFMITRHPYERIVSAFRDKIQTGNRYYRKLYQEILRAYPELRTEADEEEKIENIKDPLERARKRLKMRRITTPTFSQFIQYVIKAHEKGETMNEHWESINSFCTPCFFDIDVFAKVDSLDEDANYVIFNSGIEHVIKPKRINTSKKGPTTNVVNDYLCHLSKEQRIGLAIVYKYDMEMFDYNPEFNCTRR